MKISRVFLLALLLSQAAFADCVLREDTASQEVPLGPFVDSTDGNTAETGLSIANTDIKLQKSGATTQADKNSGGATHIATGDYYAVLDATDTDTAGNLRIKVHVSGALPVWLDCLVVTTAVYDRDYASGATGIIGTAQTGDSFARLGAPAGASVSADIVVLDNFVDDLESRLGTPSNLGGGATVAANLSDIEAQTDDIGAAGAGLTAIDLPNQTMDITGTITTVTNVTNGVNATAISGDTAAADALELAFDGTLTGARIFGLERTAFTAQSATGTTLVLDSAAAYGDNTLTGMTAVACGSTQGYCQSLAVASNVGSTDTLTLDGTWPVTPSGTITGYLFATAPGSGGSLTAADVWAHSTRSLTILDEDSTTIDLNASYVGGVTTFDEDSTTIDINATTLGTVTTATTATNLTNLPTIPANWLTAAGTAADFGTEIGTATWATTTRVLTAGTNVDGSTFTAIPWSAAWDAEVESEVNDALVAIHLNYLLATTYDPASKPGAADALLNELVESDAGVSRFTANALEQAPSGTGASAVAIADEVQTRTIAAVTTVNGLAANVITAAATATDFTTEVTSGLATASALSTLATAVNVIDDYLDTELAAIKTKTDQMAFTLANQLDVNVQSINDRNIVGTGQAGDPFVTSP